MKARLAVTTYSCSSLAPDHHLVTTAIVDLRCLGSNGAHASNVPSIKPLTPALLLPVCVARTAELRVHKGSWMSCARKPRTVLPCGRQRTPLNQILLDDRTTRQACFTSINLGSSASSLHDVASQLTQNLPTADADYSFIPRQTCFGSRLGRTRLGVGLDGPTLSSIAGGKPIALKSEWDGYWTTRI